VAINELAELMGGEIESDQDTTSASANQIRALEVMIGRKYHINITKIAWKSLIASVPIVVNLIRAQADPLGYLSVGGSVLAIIEIVRDNLKKMDSEEVPLYLAVQAITNQLKKPAEIDDVVNYLNAEIRLGAKWTANQIQEKLTDMSNKKILEKSDGHYQVVR
jgi:hypothetical protein